ncbi:MAG: metallophosphoesterase family protein [Bacteroidetes bacterium]|nr:metallophosphoesterase family protein [Bacteroidota bacterium]
MKIAVLSDIHGNSWALKEVLKDIDKRKPDLLVNLGDSLYGPLKPLETFQLIKSRKIISISGNEDRLILNHTTMNPTLEYVINDLNDEALLWLRSLKFTDTFAPGIFLCHGTPASDSTYLLEDLSTNQISTKDSGEIENELEFIDHNIILCGHSHLSKVVQITEKIIINPGSVGCQAFDDDIPIFHKVENHSNYAQYCIIELIQKKIHIDQIFVPYDFDEAANCAVKNNRPDWAHWIRTGKV